MVQRSHELESLQERMNGLVFDIEYSAEAVKDIENSQKHLNVTMINWAENFQGDRLLVSLEYSRFLGKGCFGWKTNHVHSSTTDGTASIPKERRTAVIVIEKLNVFLATCKK